MQKIDKFTQLFVLAFLLLIVTECLSLLGFVFPAVNTVVFFLISIFVVYLSIHTFPYAVSVLFAELIIGGKGYLFSYTFGSFDISIRLVLFGIVVLGGIVHVLKSKSFGLREEGLATAWTVTVIAVAYGIGRGILSHNSFKNIFLDANGYLYLAAAIPVFQVIRDQVNVRRIASVVGAALTVLVGKTIFVLGYFSHTPSEGALRTVYRWIRVTGVGEMTNYGYNIYRVFFQSHVFLFVPLFVSIVMLQFARHFSLSKKIRYFLWGSVVFSSSVLCISFSRSFWVAIAGVVFLYLLYLLVSKKISLKRVVVFLGASLAVLCVDILLLTAVINFPLPGGGGSGISAATLVRDRITEGGEEAALSSRMQLLRPLATAAKEHLFFGSGLGTTVSYQTKDPRALQSSGGVYTTYAFEWGYLDLLVKFGLFGMLAYLMFFFVIIKKLWRSAEKNTSLSGVLLFGFLLAYLALLATHMTTPYLNHPLGIGFTILLAYAFCSLFPRESKSVPVGISKDFN
ncbi:MAG: O-antigen ligase family protein [Patescibacteria group bacterium]|jgi:O-antigen ligase